jgi:nitrogen fixation protein FixH
MTASKQKEFTGRHMLLVTVSFFAVVVGVNVFMAYLASRTWTGLVVDNSYVASQEFQKKADAARQQDAAGWSMSVAYADGSLVVRLLALGEPMALTGVSAFVRRPVGGHDDVTVLLQPHAGGYEGSVSLDTGVWDVTVTTGPTSLGPIVRETRIAVQ